MHLTQLYLRSNSNNILKNDNIDVLDGYLFFMQI